MSVVDQETPGERGVNEGGQLKATSLWTSPNVGATDLYGFYAIPSGYRNPNGNYAFISNLGYQWSTNESDASSSWHRRQNYYDALNDRFANDKHYGFGIRCLRD